MISLLSIILVTSFWVLGLTAASQKDMLLCSLREWAEKKEMKIFEAIILCPWCMPSLHTAIGILFCHYSGMITFEWKIIIIYPVMVCGSSIISGITWVWYKTIEAKKGYYENAETLTYFDIKDRKGNFQRNNPQKTNHKKN